MTVDLTHTRYLRSNGYDADWVLANQMGPNALWLVESLCEVLPIEPGSRVLDLGCGRAMTSIFLAKEFGAEVSATDLWMNAEDNRNRIEAAGVADLVTAVHAEAHDLPFVEGSFDVVISVDAYQYFGTADLYLGYLLEFVRPGGRVGIVSPAGLYEIDDRPPEHLAPFWEWDFCAFHSPEWWRRHWAKTGLVTVDHADAVPDGWEDWKRFNAVSAPSMTGWRADAAVNEAAMLEADQGEYFGFSRVVATKPKT